MSDLITVTDRGLYCEAGGFYIDPWSPVDRAVITHAHADHARPGSARYLCSAPGVDVLRQRVQPDAAIEGAPYGEPVAINGVRVSLHPSGHLLGAAQVRVEHDGRVTVVSGDYKLGADPTCAAFEPVRCDTFITESTFGLPIYHWPPPEDVAADINAWWAANVEAGRTSVLFAYALGKAQRLLAMLDASVGPIVVHGAVGRFVEVYRAAGVRQPTVSKGDADAVKAGKDFRGRAMIVAPPSTAGTPFLRKFGPQSQAFASGWMQVRGTRRRRSVDRGFVLSDHADFDGLLQAIDATGASRVGVTHGSIDPFVRYLRETGRDAFGVATHFDDQDEGVDE